MYVVMVVLVLVVVLLLLVVVLLLLLVVLVYFACVVISLMVWGHQQGLVEALEYGEMGSLNIHRYWFRPSSRVR